MSTSVPSSAEKVEAISTAVLNLHSKMQWIATSTLRNFADAQDIAQETALQALAGAHNLRVVSSASGYVWSIFQCQIARRIREHLTDREAGLMSLDSLSGKQLESFPVFANAIGAEAGLIGKDVRKQKLKVLGYAKARLGPLANKILDLNVQGHDCESVKRILGITETQYRLNRSRGKKQLEWYMQRHKAEWN